MHIVSFIEISMILLDLSSPLFQVVFLGYCRGDNTGRTDSSEQELKELLTCRRMKKIPFLFVDHLLRTGADHSWKMVALPENYYVVFSTLSDSK